MVDWEGGADELDEEFRMQNSVAVDLDSDDDVPVDSEDDDIDPDQEIGTIDEKDLYSDDEMVPERDDAVASVTHKESILSCAIAKLENQCIFATGGQDDVAVLWTLEDSSFGRGVTCKERCRLEGHTDSVVQVEFSHDGKYLATAGYDGLVRIWDPQDGTLKQALEGPAKEVEWIMWHPKGHAILAGSTDTMAWMWWAPSGKLMQIFAGHGQSVTCGSWGLGGKLIITGSEDRSIIVWNPRQGTPQQHIKQVHDGSIVAMASHPDGPLVVTGSMDGTAKVLHIENGKVVANLSGHTDTVECVGFNNAAAGGMLLLATASMDGKAMVWDGKTFDLRCTLKDHFEKGGIVKFKWLPSEHANYLSTCACDSTVRLFDALSGQCLQTLQGHTDTVLDLDLMLVGGSHLTVVSSSDDKSCRVYVVPMEGAGSEQQQAQNSTASASLPFQPPARVEGAADATSASAKLPV